MKNPDHRDRLIASLPADLQAGAMEACHNISEDGNDPVVGMFATNIESTQRGFADQRETTERSTAQLREEIRSLREKLAESEEREKKLPAYISKSGAETQKTVNEGFQNLTGDKPWRRGKIKKIADGIVWLASVVAATTVIQYYQYKNEIAPLREMIADFRTLRKDLGDEPKSLAAFAKYSKEANSEALHTALSLHAISKLMTLPKMQMDRGDDGYFIITGDADTMPVGSYTDGRNWVKLANPAARVSSDTTEAIDKATEAGKKLKQK